ncbi:MAG TPA: LuxR C-terminal-related transcriptional regulator, partial [bacterium]|nr:LuxR C-terminal-related transcriptional regulator [bacterium]
PSSLRGGLGAFPWRLPTMNEFAHLLHSLQKAGSAGQLKTSFMDRAGDGLGADIFGLYLFDPANQQPSEILVRHISDGFILEYEDLKREGEPGYQRLIRTKKAVSDTAIYPAGRWKSSRLYRLHRKYKFYHYFCAPILSGNRIIGMLNLGRKQEGAYFKRETRDRANQVCRVLSERLNHFSSEAKDGAAPNSLEKFGRLRAERAVLRTHLDQVIAQAEVLPARETALLWAALTANQRAPLDYFDVDGYRYVLLSPEEESFDGDPSAELTRRELEVLREAALGEANKAIGYDLGVSIRTVSRRLASAMAKLGIRSRVLLARGLPPDIETDSTTS